MGTMTLQDCHVCGNEIEIGGLKCPFCETKTNQSEKKARRDFIHKTVNLEFGRPVVEVAIKRMNEAIEDAGRAGVSVLTLIHGYGSSGKGGIIRSECRKSLEYLKTQGVIQEMIIGEEYTKRSGICKGLLRRYPQLGSDRNLNSGNRGITVVVI
jgi:hypothetical protein